MKKAFLNIFVIVAIIVVGGGIALVGMAIRKPPADAIIVEERRPANVKVQILGSTTVDDELVLMGSLEPWEEVTLSAQTMGNIESQDIEEGDEVIADQELARVDTGDLQVALAQYKTQYELAKRELERIDNLSEEGISSPQQQDRAKLDYDVAYINFRATEIELEDSVVRAKFDGIIDTLYQEEGEFVNVGAPLVRLVQLDKIKMVLGIPERDVAHFAKGDRVEVELDALPGRKFAGTIFRVAATADNTTHTFKTEITLDNSDGKLKPGMIAQARLIRGSYPNSVMAPLFSLITTDDGRYTFVDDGGVARLRDVEVGLLKGNMIHVTQGLASGDRLIVVGQRDLRDGDKIAVREVIQ